MIDQRSSGERCCGELMKDEGKKGEYALLKVACSKLKVMKN